MPVSAQLTDQLTRAIDQVCSPVYQQTFESAAKNQSEYRGKEQQIILSSYPNSITWYVGGRRPEIVERIRRTHLKWCNTWLALFNTGRPPYPEWSSSMTLIVLHLNNMLFRIDRDDFITSSETREEFLHIANTIKDFLLTIKESNPVVIDQRALPLVRNMLQILFYCTLDNVLVIQLKTLQLVDLMNVLLQTSNNDDEIHLQAYRILAVIMAETDIKQLQDSSRIAAVFINFIKNTIDGGVQTENRLQNNLRSLKVLTQHDQIREELIKQNGHLLFLRCALEDQFDSLKVKLPALEILLALAFNKGFATSLKDNTNFMDHVRTLTTSSTESLQRVATALIWKLEKESDVSVKKSENESSSSSTTPVVVKKQYDMMISYSHNDNELCHRIAKRLEQDKLRIWTDTQQIHGNMQDVIADAIENSEFVLVCMSDTYKQSAVCKSEAGYAVNRHCHIIPLVMTANYKADGWLGLLTSSLIYIDFPKRGFDTGYEELKHQIQRTRSNTSHPTTVKQDKIHNDHSSLMDIASKTRPFVEYPHCIDMWTEDHVKSFLLDKKLSALLGAFDGMNGRLLHKAYAMCQSNPQAMFSSLKEDVIQSQHNATLTLKDYLIFLEEIKAYIPYTAVNALNPASAVCNLM